MDFLKKHYEKIILSVVLLGLAVAAALMPQRVSEAQQKVDELKAIMIPPSPKERPAVDIQSNKVMLAHLQRPTVLTLGLPHYVFNPVRWERKANGVIFKIKSDDDIGPRAVSVQSIRPLHLVISMMGTTGSDDALRYQVSVVRETDSSPRPKTFLMRPGDRNEVFQLREVKGLADAPTEFVLELRETQKLVTISKEAPYMQVIGYMADLKYEPRNKTWQKMKRGSRLQIENENYKIIEITETEVVLSNDSTGKRTIITQQSAQK